MVTPEDTAKVITDRPVEVAPADLIERATQLLAYMSEQLPPHSRGACRSPRLFHNANDQAETEAYARTILGFQSILSR